MVFVAEVAMRRDSTQRTPGMSPGVGTNVASARTVAFDRAVAFALTVVVSLITCAGCSSNTQDAPGVNAVTGPSGTVTLSFDSGNGPPVIVDVPGIADATTLESVMRRVDEVDVELSGSGSTAFVHSINGVATRADEGWTFKIDGQHANQGVGMTELHPPTRVEWRFGSFQMLDE